MQLSSLLLAFATVAADLPAAPASSGTPAEGTSSSQGQPPQEAVDAFFRGRKLYAEGRWEEALESFLEADRLFPAPDLQYNIGLCHERLEHWDDAIKAFEIYLRTKSTAADREAVEGRIERAKLQRDEEKNAAVTPRTDERQSDTGNTTGPDDRTDPPKDDAKPYVGMIAAGSVLLALGTAGALGGALGVGFAVQRKNDKLDEILQGGNPSDVSYSDAKDIEREAKRLVTYQYVAASIGAAVAVTGAVLLGIGLKRRADARRNGNVSLLPGVGPRGAGVVLQGKF